jgi:hypothetical protein
MTRILNLAAVMLIACAAAAASAQSTISAENLLFSPPQGFKVGFQSNRANMSMTEWVPAAETVEDWSRMVTVQIFRGVPLDPASFLQELQKRYTSACPGTTATRSSTGKVNGYVVSMQLLKCPKNPGTGKPETTASRVIKGNDALYSVQRAWRAVPPDKEIDDVMQALATVTVCDTRTPEHPCPSFNSLVPLK